MNTKSRNKRPALPRVMCPRCGEKKWKTEAITATVVLVTCSICGLRWNPEGFQDATGEPWYKE